MGSSVGVTVADGVAVGDGLISTLGVTVGDDLARHTVGVIVKATVGVGEFC